MVAHDLTKARPAHEPIAVRCQHCGSPISVQDERAQLVVCGACGSHNELTGPERQTLELLSPGGGKNPGFELDLGQSFKWRGARYEVVARELWVEENDLRYSTRVYTLYHPRKPLLSLDEYHGTWTVMVKTHVQVQGELAGLRPGQLVRTYDGRSWTLAETLTRELRYVDGCLPWIAKVGDAVLAWELRGKDRERFEIEATGGEREHNEGTLLTTSDLARALPGVSLTSKPPEATHEQRLKASAQVMGAGVLGVVLNALLLGTTFGAGREVHTERFEAAELADEVVSAPFQLEGDGLLRLEFTAPDLSDAWMVVDYALIQGEDQVVLVADEDVSYYSGVEGGESWSEGSRSTSALVSGASPGEHRLLVRGLGNRGETESADHAVVGLNVSISEGAHSRIPAVFGMILSAAIFVLGTAWYSQLKEDE